MSLYGRFFKPEEKLTFRKVLDRVGVFSAVECRAYIESDRQAMYELFKKEVDGKLAYCNLASIVEKTFNIMGLTKYSTIYKDEEAGISDLSS